MGDPGGDGGRPWRGTTLGLAKRARPPWPERRTTLAGPGADGLQRTPQNRRGRSSLDGGVRRLASDCGGDGATLQATLAGTLAGPLAKRACLSLSARTLAGGRDVLQRAWRVTLAGLASDPGGAGDRRSGTRKRSLAGDPGGDDGRPWRGTTLALAKQPWQATLAETADDPGGRKGRTPARKKELGPAHHRRPR